MTTAIETEPVLQCSFCGKLAPEVSKLIAGPGVYICDICVDTCNSILANEVSGEEPRIPTWTSMTDEQVLGHLPKIAAAGAQVEDSLRRWVVELRRRGVTWVRIGTVLGMTRQSAWERFSGEE